MYLLILGAEVALVRPERGSMMRQATHALTRPTTRQTLRALIPSGVRRLRRERYLRRRFGLISLGYIEPQRIDVSSTFGRNCRINGPIFVMSSQIGDYTYLEAGSRILRADIGRFCAVAPYAQIGLAGHPIDREVSGHPAFYLRKPAWGYDFVEATTHTDLRRTTIGHDVWIGAGALVKDGVDVGHGAVIAAGAVVTKDVEPYAVVAGVPAAPLRYRFTDEEIDFLLQLAWWDRSDEWLHEHAHLMSDLGRLRAHTT